MTTRSKVIFLCLYRYRIYRHMPATTNTSTMPNTAVPRSPAASSAVAAVSPPGGHGSGTGDSCTNDAIERHAFADHHHNLREQDGDSDDEGDVAEVFVHRAHEDNEDVEDEFDAGDGEDVELSSPTPGPSIFGECEPAHNEDEDDDANAADDANAGEIPGAPKGWNPPCAPTDYKYTPRPGEPAPETIDNPGGWDDYTFRAKFEGRGRSAKYKHHRLPAGAIPVPKGEDGKRKAGGYEFHYKGYKGGTQHRSGAGRMNVCPPERRGTLDVEILKGLGITADVVKNGDAWSFLELIFPVSETKKSAYNTDGFVDPRKPHYTDVHAFTNQYRWRKDANGNVPAGPYGHTVKEVSIEEVVRWESIVGYDGALGGSHGAIHQRWMEGDDFDGIRNEDIKKAMEYDRFLGIKRVFKLNDNAEAPTDKNDPAYATAKFDFIAQVVVHNTNAITKKAEDDLCVDETTCAYGIPFFNTLFMLNDSKQKFWCARKHGVDA